MSTFHFSARHRPVRFRSSSWCTPDGGSSAFSCNAQDLGSLPTPLAVVWYPSLAELVPEGQGAKLLPPSLGQHRLGSELLLRRSRHTASAVVYTCSSSRRSPAPLIAGLFPSRFPPRLLTGMTLRQFGISACTANPEGQPPSLAQHGSCCRSSTSTSLPFQDTPAQLLVDSAGL
jgi:hypothetical protein